MRTIILLLDTSHLEYLYVAVARETIICEKRVDAKFLQQEKLLQTISDIFAVCGVSLQDVAGVIAVTGPGSFSSLRIGLAAVNAIAYTQDIRAVGLVISEFEDYSDLLKQGVLRLQRQKSFAYLVPKYGAEPHITT